MEYTYSKVINYGKIIEIFRYEKNPNQYKRKKRNSKIINAKSLMVSNVQNTETQPTQIKRKDSIRRAQVGFYRLVLSNLQQSEAPLLATFTYWDNFQDLQASRNHWHTFNRRAQKSFGQQYRSIAITEYQKRGAIHYHALLWGITDTIFREERYTRMVAGLWSHGFVDLKKTDGSPKLAGYLTKYFTKQLVRPEFFRRKAYIATRNVMRPIIDVNPILSAYYAPETHNLSPLTMLTQMEYPTQWLGRCLYQQHEKKV